MFGDMCDLKRLTENYGREQDQVRERVHCAVPQQYYERKQDTNEWCGATGKQSNIDVCTIFLSLICSKIGALEHF